MKPHELLRQARIAAGFPTAKAASDAFGWAQKTYYDHEHGNTQFAPHIEKYAKAFGIQPHGLERQAKPHLPIVDHTDFNAIAALSRGVIGDTQGLLGRLSLEKADDAFAIANPNGAMSPKFEAGDWLIFQWCQDAPDGSHVLATLPNSHSVAFRALQTADNGRAVLMALNPHYKPFVAGRTENFKILGRLIGCWKSNF